MIFLYYCMIFTVTVLPVIGQKKCEDYSPDADCTKFIRCFHNVRIRFSCPPGTAWENTLKTCIWKEYVESCGSKEKNLQRSLDTDDTTDLYEADVDALNNITIGQTLVEAKALGAIVTPKQFQCSLCNPNPCGVVVSAIQCVCASSQCPPQTTAKPRNPCSPNPCLNGGKCVSNGLGFVCNCPSTHTGNRCEAPAFTPCQPNPCQNGGTCTPQGFNFQCRCPTSYQGRCCEIRITTPPNPCAQSPCQNGGRCVPSGNFAMCQCPTGYYGMRCENKNYCMPNPCSNNGLCTQTPAGYMCSCSYPYTGTNCEEMIATQPPTTVPSTRPQCSQCQCMVTPCPTYIVLNPCVPNPCQNMGACGVQNNGAQCWCSSYYTGFYCQHRVNIRSLSSRSCNKTCLNGGKCYIDEENEGQQRCSCPNEYYGSRCEKMNRPKSCEPRNPCMNNGQCVTSKTGSKCVCQKGTSGVLCEKVQMSNKQKYCPLDCQAGGICVYVKSKAKCRCPKGRTGNLCQSRLTKILTDDENELDLFNEIN